MILASYHWLGGKLSSRTTTKTFCFRFRISLFHFGRWFIHWTDSQLLKYFVLTDSSSLGSWIGLRLSPIRKCKDVRAIMSFPSSDNGYVGREFTDASIWVKYKYPLSHRNFQYFPFDPWQANFALRIWLTMPMSVAHGERSFSKLEIIKNYLRNSMNTERLHDLAIISIESQIAEAIEYDDVIENFANKKARKKAYE